MERSVRDDDRVKKVGSLSASAPGDTIEFLSGHF